MSGPGAFMVLGVLATILLVKALRHALLKVLRVVRPAWFWFSGHSMDGAHRTNATWTKRSHGDRAVLHPSAIWWHHLPRLHRAGHRTGGTALVGVITYGLVAATFATVVSLCCAATAAVTFGVWHGVHVARNWRHERHFVRPLEKTLLRGIPEAPASLEVQVRHDESGADVIEGVVIEWPPDAELREPERQYALEAVTTRLPIEAPDVKWQLKGRARLATFTPSEPPPFPVFWEGRIAAAVARAAFNELVFGIGKRDTIGEAAYSESPHIAVPGGSGGGKSNLIAFLVLQELLRGTLVFILDPKATSHAWAINLPNVIYAVEAPEIRMALTWIAAERKRRSRNAHLSAAHDGIVRARPGRRILAVGEELNIGMPEIKAEWAAARDRKTDPKESPAISGLRDLACAGRANDMHAIFAAQLFNVESTGVKDSAIRSQAGIKAMLRWDEPGWNMAIGKKIPMPPPTDTPGRIQLVTGSGVREVQVPYLHLDDEDHPAVHEKAVRWARELAVSKDVAQIPTGDFGVPEELWPPVVRQGRLALNAGQGPETGTTVAGSPPPPPALTIREAVERDVFGDLDLGAARRRVQRAGLRETGERDSDGAKKYLLTDLRATAKGSANDSQ